jgi:hypothetical protein
MVTSGILGDEFDMPADEQRARQGARKRRFETRFGRHGWLS